jgi:hypothetical protein
VTATDTIHFAENVVRVRGFNRFPVESITFTESATRSPQVFSRSALDLLTLVEVLVSIGPPTVKGSVEATGSSALGLDGRSGGLLTLESVGSGAGSLEGAGGSGSVEGW